MDYPCAKFGNFIFSRFGFIVRSNRHTHTHTQTADRITDAAKRFTPRLSSVRVITKTLLRRQLQIIGHWRCTEQF